MWSIYEYNIDKNVLIFFYQIDKTNKQTEIENDHFSSIHKDKDRIEVDFFEK